MLIACRKVTAYTAVFQFSDFIANQLVYDATSLNLKLIGVRAFQIHHATRHNIPNIDWEQATGIQDLVAYNPDGYDDEAIWKTVQYLVPDLEQQLASYFDAAENDGSGISI